MLYLNGRNAGRHRLGRAAGTTRQPVPAVPSHVTAAILFCGERGNAMPLRDPCKMTGVAAWDVVGMRDRSHQMADGLTQPCWFPPFLLPSPLPFELSLLTHFLSSP